MSLLSCLPLCVVVPLLTCVPSGVRLSGCLCLLVSLHVPPNAYTVLVSGSSDVSLHLSPFVCLPVLGMSLFTCLPSFVSKCACIHVRLSDVSLLLSPFVCLPMHLALPNSPDVFLYFSRVIWLPLWWRPSMSCLPPIVFHFV